MQAVALLDVDDRAALLVQQVGRDLDRHDGADLRAAILAGFLLDQTQHRQRERLGIADRALAGAARADHRTGLLERGTQPLARHFHQAEARDLADLHARAVRPQRIAQPVLHLALAARAAHVDEVDHDQAAHVAQAQLACHLVGSLQVGLQRGFLDVLALGRARGVDVDRHQRLGGVDHDRAARRELHLALVRRLDLALDLVAVEQRHRVLVQLHAVAVVRHHQVDELDRLVEGFLRVDQHLVDVGTQAISDRTDHDVAFLVDQQRRALLVGRGRDRLPQVQQVVEVPLQFLGRTPHAGGADDDAHAVGQVERVQRIAQLGTLLALDAAADAAGARVVRHQHEVASGQADERGQRGTLVAAFFLVHLHQYLGAFADHVADARPALGVVRAAALEVLARDFLQRQEAVAIGAEFDERGLEAGLDARDAALVDVGLGGDPVTVLDVQIVQSLAVDHCDPQLLWLGCVDEHAFHGYQCPVSRLLGLWYRRSSVTDSIACRAERSCVLEVCFSRYAATGTFARHAAFVPGRRRCRRVGDASSVFSGRAGRAPSPAARTKISPSIPWSCRRYLASAGSAPAETGCSTRALTLQFQSSAPLCCVRSDPCYTP
ncbi:MAG: hypothetical protein CALGDGBN_01853 [Pseudomonadales bacterium]|nr:hypothetical protein [Pseudomonadales bacterium]